MVNFARANSSVGEADGTATVSVMLSTVPAAALPLTYAVGGTATAAEAGQASFTLTAAQAPASDLAVTVDVADVPGGDFVAAADEGARTLTITTRGDSRDEGAGETLTVSLGSPDGNLDGGASVSAGITFRIADDDEPDGTVRAALASGAGYRVGAASSASVAVSDDDATALATLSIGDATQAEGGGRRSQFDPDVTLMEFAIRLSAPQRHTVRVTAATRDSTPVSARAGHDYTPARLLAEFLPGRTVAHVWVRIVDDSHDEGGETFELVLSSPRGAVIGDGTAVATITNDDPMPAAWLSRFGRTVAEQALDGIAGRMAAPRDAGARGGLAGRGPVFDPSAGGARGRGRIHGSLVRRAHGGGGTVMRLESVHGQHATETGCGPFHGGAAG